MNIYVWLTWEEYMRLLYTAVNVSFPVMFGSDFPPKLFDNNGLKVAKNGIFPLFR